MGNYILLDLLGLNQDPQYPFYLHISDAAGKHGKPLTLATQEELEGTRSVIEPALKEGREILLLDGHEQRLIHIKDRQLLLPK